MDWRLAWGAPPPALGARRCSWPCELSASGRGGNAGALPATGLFGGGAGVALGGVGVELLGSVGLVDVFGSN